MGVQQLMENVKPKNITRCYAAPVGPVGDVIVKTRVRQSMPSLPWAYDPYWQGKRANKLGSNVQDGGQASFLRKTFGPNVLDSNWNSNRTKKHQYGETYHSVQTPDKLVDPVLRPLGAINYRSKLGRSTNIKRQGRLFSVLPQGFQPSSTDVLRGGSYPIVTAISGGTDAPGTLGGAITQQDPVFMEADEGPLVSPAGTPGGMGDLRAGFSRLGFQNVGLRRQMASMRI